LVGSAGSVGANYREANDSLGKKDFILKLRIARREAKESAYWLELVLESNTIKTDKIQPLLRESIELKNILSSIIAKSEK
jgi:four helix bundle protein